MALLSLFTTPSAAAFAPSGGGVADAVRAGAAKSGVNFDFLMRTAQRESSLDPNARAGTSTATGLFQFIDQTWLQTVKLDGAKHGLGRYAEAITSANGRYSVPDPAMRAEILALRRDAQTSAALAGELTRRNGAALADSLGRAASDGELYLAHVMGSRGASALIRRAAAAPSEKAAGHFPEEASANRDIFYTRAGRARSLAEVHRRLTEGFGSDGAAAPLASSAQDVATGGAWLSFFPQATTPARAVRPFDSLFNTETARGPVSNAVVRLWASRDAQPRADALFPAGSGETIAAPQLAREQAVPTAPPARRSRAPGKPLNLQALMKPVTT